MRYLFSLSLKTPKTNVNFDLWGKGSPETSFCDIHEWYLFSQTPVPENKGIECTCGLKRYQRYLPPLHLRSGNTAKCLPQAKGRPTLVGRRTNIRAKGRDVQASKQAQELKRTRRLQSCRRSLRRDHCTGRCTDRCKNCTGRRHRERGGSE